MTSIGARAGFISKLMADEMPENIEDVFSEGNTRLLPDSYEGFLVECSCPDYFVPCKHIAGACYRLASLLDRDAFLLFEMRGLTRDKLHKELAKTPLGKILSESLVGKTDQPLPADTHYTRPKSVDLPETVDAKDFWSGTKPMPTSIEPAAPAAIPAVVIKKAGDYPPFWDKQTSFIEVMEEFYERVRKNSKQWM